MDYTDITRFPSDDDDDPVAFSTDAGSASQANVALAVSLNTTEIVTFASSGIVFNNTYTANVSAAYKAAILAAEKDLASHWSNSVTINAKFDSKAQGQNGTLASNSFSLLEGISYASLKSALAAHTANNPDGLAAVNSLLATDPSGGVGQGCSTLYSESVK